MRWLISMRDLFCKESHPFICHIGLAVQVIAEASLGDVHCSVKNLQINRPGKQAKILRENHFFLDC